MREYKGRGPRRKKPGRVAMGLWSIAGVMGGGLLFAAPAQAAAPTDCPPTYACLWGDTAFKTGGATASVIKLKQYIPALRPFSYYGTSRTGHDSASSVFNNGSTDTAYFFKNENHGGAWFKKSTNDGDSDFTNGSPPGSFNDSLDSVYFATLFVPIGG
ncbi:hypothetical protein ET475_15505 [Microbacterium protaetiae]|uniref:Peptidase inhibitor family I36 protein n=1 Tax=Microbacterium protaetiae TaxID=2509458 RepID=A0A4P6ET86_9MICO|nr:peptidase inhibitor family I36 protein [Microbacterium protaetiae]QAY61248.1 hypothetical protein ET475_15505 [Microbacterium protaetiae]